MFYVTNEKPRKLFVTINKVVNLIFFYLCSVS